MSLPRRALATSRARAAAYYRLRLLPAMAQLPPWIVYGVACARGDARFWRDAAGRERIVRNLAAILGDQLTPEQRRRSAREFFRLQYCSLMDWLRLRGDGRALTDLVEVRGLEHLREALDAGKGALICTGHFGDYQAIFSVLGALGVPVTAVKRESVPNAEDAEGQPSSEGLLRDALAHHLSRPYINPLQGQFASAVQAAQVLRQNEVLGVYIDPPALEADRSRTSLSTFLGHQVRLLTGILTVAQKTKSPVFVALLHRAPDWQHQVLEISAPIPVEADSALTFQRCLSVIEAAVRRQPGQWLYWDRTDDLVELGLLPEAALDPRATSASATRPVNNAHWVQTLVLSASVLVVAGLLFFTAKLPGRGRRSA